MADKRFIYDQLNPPKKIPSNPGDQFLNEYQEEFRRDGESKIVKIGEKNIYDLIQVDLESTKIENILQAVAKGDLSVLQSREGLYVDATEMPKTLMEAQNMVIKAQSEFLTLPQEVRNLFHNNPEEYVAKMGTQEFLDLMSPYNEEIKNINNKKATEEYNAKVAAQAKFEKDVAAAKGAES